MTSTESSTRPRYLIRSVLLAADASRPAAGYAAVYSFTSSSGRHVYVGSTSNLEVRLNRHLRISTWVQFADLGEVCWLPTLREARFQETEAIARHSPLFNIKGADPGARQRLVRFLVDADRLDLLAPSVRLG